ncbi:hypothetical protein QN277_004705 [Acacia crassicarpa]|uniref:MATH domain-containing protein n=1 Tax=Acacia crassicarpa TaxID=499986 RepID=A0AAE1J4Y3_9FABA|nr:hypothetical protein QN277_004705 [Acacia crassicarpa]
MKNQEVKDISCKKIAWTVRSFSKLKTNIGYYSWGFTIGDRAWKVALYRGSSQDGKSLAIFLRVADASSLPQGWCIYADFTITVVHQLAREKSITRGQGLPTKFNGNAVSWGYAMPLTTLEDPSSGYISKDECIVEVEIYSVRSEGINKPTSHPTYPSLFKEVKEAAAHLKGHDDGFIDFKDLGRIEKSFVSLLEEVCLWHPSLLNCKKNKSHKFTEWAFTALGRVLQFLKDKKWKDMNEEACEQLQHLWEELEISGLHLGWLEPVIKSALNMRGYEEKAEKVKRLKQELMVLEAETKERKGKLGDNEQKVESIRKELMNVEDAFEEKDLDAEIGYGKKP